VRRLVAIAVVFATSGAAAAVRKDFPYPGSVYESVDEKRAPLLVVLHGDNQSASAMRDIWSAPASKRSIAVLYLQCPKALGCAGSFWSWNGEPKFLDDAVDKVAGDIDPDRVWIAAWSGGASYLGMRAFELSERYSAISINGGGLAPQRNACPERVLPTYFLVGDKNPLHHYAQDLRAALERCKAEIVWDLRAGAAHDGEWKALKKDADTVLAWFEKHPRAIRPSVATAAPSVAIADAGTVAPPAPPATPPPPARCACDLASRAPVPTAALLILLGAIVARRYFFL